jgi:hypothetical protein
MLHLGTRFVNAVMTSTLEMFAGVAKKPQRRGAPIQEKPRGEGQVRLDEGISSQLIKVVKWLSFSPGRQRTIAALLIRSS